MFLTLDAFSPLYYLNFMFELDNTTMNEQFKMTIWNMHEDKISFSIDGNTESSLIL
jgi:hypothetical protein